MSERRPRRTSRFKITLGPPRAGFLKSIRRVIFVGWAALIVASAPSSFKDVQRAWALPSGPPRRMAVADVIVNVVMVDLALPFATLAMFGYGVVPNRNYLITGKPPVGLSWDEAQRKKDAKKRR